MDNNQPQPPTKLKAIFGGRCPSCHKGPVFLYPLTKVTTEFLNAHQNCSHCGVKYSPEPGFFLGSMYFNYAFNVATIALVGALMYFGFQASSPWTYIIAIMLTVVATIPLTARLSRMMWLHFFGPYSFQAEKYNAAPVPPQP